MLAPLTKASGRIVKSFDRVAYSGWLAAGGIVIPILVWVWPVGPWGAVALGLLTILLCVPGLIIFLLARAVGSLSELPSALINQVSAAAAPPSLELSGGFRSVWNVGRYLVGIRGVLWAMKDQLTSAGMVLRVASMPVLIGTLVAVVIIAAMIPLSFVMVAAMLLTL